ncbi:hypothetical protein N431DRAFT_539452 [Stipitochalara longipes BDJ]|nr:hypothetical protein N431DRAFT_539452 [Stipitochalara longipes BDJ]
MLDPMTALSLAGNIVQFVDFSTKLIVKGHELYTSCDGASVGNAELEVIAKDLQELNERLKPSQTEQAGTTRLTDSDIALCKLSEQCSRVAGELISALEKLKVQGTANRRWKSFRQALKWLMKKEEVEAIAQRLQTFRNELDLHILVSMRENLDMQAVTQTEGFRDLNQVAQDLVQKLEKEQDQLREALKDNTEHLSHGQNYAQQLILNEHERTRRTILDSIQSNREKQPLQWTQGVAKDSADIDQMEKDRTAEVLLLANLRFPTMERRVEEIEPAHRKTFEWIFRSPRGPFKWSNFPEWLSKGAGIYWVNGKAASGKSTLMRYMCHDPQITTLLNQWSGSKQLVRASHFFWNSGAIHQRSYEGLLRGLLFEILQQSRHLIRVVFPDTWARLRVQQNMSAQISESWTVRRLSNAFDYVFQASSDSRFCLFIDGLDEYEDDPLDVIDLFIRLSKLPNIKFCLSSRPLYDFVRAFRAFPTLRLQDLNFGDIKQYVEDKLSTKLSLEIIEKADGVFLWVRLVVHSLLRGLRNSDHVVDLQRRLRLLPPSLEDLFNHILGRLEPVYLKQSSRIFQIFAASRLTDDHFTSLELSFAEEPDAYNLLSSRIEPLSDTERASRIELVDIWLVTRCGGLIEAHNRVGADDEANPTLSYLHRTVRDFLELPQVWSRILDPTRGSDFNPYIPVLQSSILFIRFILNPCDHEAVFDGRYISDFAAKSLRQAYLAELKIDQAAVLLLDTLGQDILQGRHPWLHYSRRGGLPIIGDQEYQHELLTIAVSNGLCHYVEHKLKQDPYALRYKTGPPLLFYAVSGAGLGQLRLSSSMIWLLLRYGSNIHEFWNGNCAWYFILKQLTEYAKQSHRGLEKRESAFKDNDTCVAEVKELHDYIVSMGGPIRPKEESHSIRITDPGGSHVRRKSGPNEQNRAPDIVDVELEQVEENEDRTRRWTLGKSLPVISGLSSGNEILQSPKEGSPDTAARQVLQGQRKNWLRKLYRSLADAGLKVAVKNS